MKKKKPTDAKKEREKKINAVAEKIHKKFAATFKALAK